MYRRLLFFFYLYFTLSLSATLVNRPVVNMYAAPSEEAEVLSQAIYASSVEVVATSDDWTRIKTPDGDSGWTLSSDLIDNQKYWMSPLLRPISSLFAHVYLVRDTEPRKPLMTLPFSTMVQLVERPDADSRWLLIRLIDGQKAWIQRGDLNLDPKPIQLDMMLALSKKFLGLPYTWGGSSSYGFDCTGYVQMLYKQMGVLLPRHVCPQAPFEQLMPQSPLLDSIELSELLPGDLVFFAHRYPHHVGIYLGHDEFIHAGVRDHRPFVNINNLKKTDYQLAFARRLKPLNYTYSISEITPDIKARMQYSWRDDNPVALEDLRFLKIRHWGYDDLIHEGELVVHALVAQDVVDIFGELFKARFPVEKIRLIDEYQADDEASCTDNNSSAFCSRMITGSTNLWSNHSYGCAVDINPLVNPYARNGYICPKAGAPYLDRTHDVKGKIDREGVCCQAFLKRGWEWGGDWTSLVDYQHFEKNLYQNLPDIVQNDS